MKEYPYRKMNEMREILDIADAFKIENTLDYSDFTQTLHV